MTDQLLAPLLLAAAVGVRHAFEADHIAAVATIASERSGWRRAAALGFAWGAGHAAALIVATVALISTRRVLRSDVVLILELAIGVVIIVLAARLLIDALNGKRHIHEHVHGAIRHAHDHTHDRSAAEGHHDARVLRRPFAVGVLHGAAGSAALMIGTASAARGAMEAAGVVVVFGLGSMIGMILASTAASVPLSWTARRGAMSLRLFSGAIAFASIAFGVHYCYSVVAGGS